VLGFETRYIHGHGRRGESEDFANYAIILDEGGPVWTRAGTGYLYLRVRDVDATYADVKSHDVPIDRPLQHENWPARGFNINDPSRNDVHIEQPD
jgi:catechol 2,3-dioxygenase-like lactoylglutathione lyase family enzyme